MNLNERELVGELMDDPALDPREHERALRGLARLNRLSAAHAPIHAAVRGRFTEGFDLLDVASGSGDVLMGVALLLRGHRKGVRFHACDVSPVACARIEARFGCRRIPVRVFTADALDPGALGGGSYHVVMNSLFLHHLTRDDAVRALRAMADALHPGGLLVVSDLVRSEWGYRLAWLASRLLTRSRVVHTDALLSVRSAYRPDDLHDLAESAGLVGVRVRRVWPQRMLLTWVKS